MAGYVRLSRDDDKKKYGSITEQKNMIIDYYRKNLGYTGIITFFEDDDESGYSFNRPGFLKLEAEVYKNNVSVLVMKDFSRLGRKGWKTEEIYERFVDDYNVRVIAINDGHDSHDINAREIMGIHTWSNERYVRDISRKVTSSFRQRQERGDLIITVPYGYAKKSGRIVVDHLAAGVVREIFALYISGYGYRKIADKLNKKGCLAPSAYKNRAGARSKWSFQAVKNILANEFYNGTLLQRKTYKKKIKGLSYKTPSEGVLRFSNHHEPLIDRETFMLVQNIMHDRRKGRIKGARPEMHIFSGKIFCSKCGKTFVYRKKNKCADGPQKAGYYICGSQFKYGPGVCRNMRIAEDRLLSDIRRIINKLLSDNPCFMETLEEITDKHPENGRENGFLKNTMAEIEKRKRALQKIYLDKLNNQAKIPEDVMENAFERISGEIRLLKSRLQVYRDAKNSESPVVGRLPADRGKEKIKMFLERDYVRRDVDILIDAIKIEDTEENPVKILWRM